MGKRLFQNFERLAINQRFQLAEFFLAATSMITFWIWFYLLSTHTEVVNGTSVVVNLFKTEDRPGSVSCLS
jgi:hypothetical protein